MRVPLQPILDSLDLEPAGPGRYRARHAGMGHGVVFGGQLLAQSIMAALEDAGGKSVKTIHTVFTRGGSPELGLEIDVESLADGRTIASRSVSIRQDGRLCTRSTVLLSADEPDLIRHADSGPGRPAPVPGTNGTEAGWDVEVVDGVDISDPHSVGPAELDVWSRFRGAPDDPLVGQALLAFATDGFLIGTAMRPHPGVGQAQAHLTLSTGVLSHTLTFHEPFSAADWVLMTHRSTYAGRGRSYGRAEVYGADGTLLASFVQDSLIRAKTDRPGAL